MSDITRPVVSEWADVEDQSFFPRVQCIDFSSESGLLWFSP